MPTTSIETSVFFRLKAAQHDLILRAGGIERAGDICGYSKTHVARWGSREHPELMPLAAVVALEADTGAPLVTKALCGAHGLEVTPAAKPEAHLMGAYVAVTSAAADLTGKVASAIADGVVTPTESRIVDEAAASVQRSAEAVRASVAQAGGKPLHVINR